VNEEDGEDTALRRCITCAMVKSKSECVAGATENSSTSRGEEGDNSAEESCGSEDADDDVTLGLNDGILTMPSKKRKHTVRLEAAVASKLARERKVRKLKGRRIDTLHDVVHSKSTPLTNVLDSSDGAKRRQTTVWRKPSSALALKVRQKFGDQHIGLNCAFFFCFACKVKLASHSGAIKEHIFKCKAHKENVLALA
jgi:hypothetical protein